MLSMLAPIARLAMAVGLLVLSCGSASACALWFCFGEPDPHAYPPMYVPVPDPRLGPQWTSSGWSYPPVRTGAEPLPYWPGAVRGDRPRPHMDAGLERHSRLK